ncbi:hypothetical protein C8246_07205 [Paracidovorax avenae]|nr:hypothetical protein C8246_07205 [Paracidovorax avenae]
MLKAIEEKYGFVYPELYLRLYQENMLGWGGQRPNWHEEVYPKIRDNPPFLLFANDFKIIETAEIENYIPRIEERVNGKFKLIPFGRDGAGDLYSFKYHSEGSLDSVCILNWDGSLIRLARDFEDFIFRELLGSVVQINPKDIEDEDEYNRDLFAMLESHKPYLTAKRYNIIKSIYSKNINEEDGEFGKISIDEYYEILDQEIRFAGINKKIML